MVFQLTASQGGWPYVAGNFSFRDYISTHSLTRRLTLSGLTQQAFSEISTHSLTRRLTILLPSSWVSIVVFQLTASQGGWPGNGVTATTVIYFNSQPHKEADGNYVKKYDLSGISTHSLTRRLTSFNCHIFYLLLFQLTASQGGWQQDLDRKSYLLQISTHSLTRRLTLWIMPFLSRTLFQLTASQGGWLIFATCLLFLINYFNSQPHKEADLVWHRLRGIYPYFNSQPHKEADHGEEVEVAVWEISTHSLTRRLTTRPCESSGNAFISTHSLTRRLTKSCGTCLRNFVLFQLTASQGGWRYRRALCQICQVHFNSQPHKEADINADTVANMQNTFQLTASQGGWQKLSLSC